VANGNREPQTLLLIAATNSPTHRGQSPHPQLWVTASNATAAKTVPAGQTAAFTATSSAVAVQRRECPRPADRGRVCGTVKKRAGGGCRCPGLRFTAQHPLADGHLTRATSFYSPQRAERVSICRPAASRAAVVCDQIGDTDQGGRRTVSLSISLRGERQDRLGAPASSWSGGSSRPVRRA